ncbi:hypothetical protein [Pseudonocardia sp. MH-G8]|uniref:hypothetical protein n=1 Tax=Pseudonocardia sp. MH-G8 TaxID=1854588 RepID=UPI000BA1646D|nr:hypothetical protein [Pseudonocardia sp. MH-G8]OZM81504.1 hypothetical protein CFP66_15325 [Pseudonocardia sp. MH-G8]
MCAEGAATFRHRPPGPSFAQRVVTIAPGASHPYDEQEWRDALVAVEEGELVVECRAGGRRAFGTGAVLWFVGLDVVTLHNVSTTRSTVLVAVSRRRPPAVQDPPPP